VRARHDVAVIGGGIVGLATAVAILDRRPPLRLVLLEKERRVGFHQTGHNSGVVHSGIYYRPGSLKARLCRAGGERLRSFCSEHGIALVERGKLVVATSEAEVVRLEELLERGTANGVPGLEIVPGEAIGELEPHATGVAALRIPGTAVVDFAEVASAMAREVVAGGAELVVGAEVIEGERRRGGWRLRTTAGDLEAGLVVACAGLQSDRVARALGARPPVRIVPFRGEYWSVARPDLVRGLVYPVPHPRFPFLGVHLTRDGHGGVHAGPNAVLALAREGYGSRRPSPRDAWEALAYPGTLALGIRHWRTGASELLRSRGRGAFAEAARRLVPEIEPSDLVTRTDGIRAQAVARDGRLLDDFATLWSDGALHVLNAPSPAATASLAIGEWLARALEEAGALAT
jgi:L-2-hydroxyglutarate oxidase LhgO